MNISKTLILLATESKIDEFIIVLRDNLISGFVLSPVLCRKLYRELCQIEDVNPKFLMAIVRYCGVCCEKFLYNKSVIKHLIITVKHVSKIEINYQRETNTSLDNIRLSKTFMDNVVETYLSSEIGSIEAYDH